MGLGTWLLVAAGGALGTLLRVAVAELGGRALPGSWWPLGTFAANALGSFLLALLFVVGEGRTVLGADVRLVFGTGTLGAFTTYSTYNLEALRLITDGQPGRGVLYLALTLALCLAAGFAGLALGRSLSA
ncbi:MAG: CrcB family protein [Myxococcota bacterium]